MATHDYSIANQSFPATRSDINNALTAIKSSNSGATAPTASLLSGQLFFDTNNNKLQVYTGAAFKDVALDASGNLTVTNDLTVAGDVTISGTLTESSSRELKTAINSLGPQLSKVMELNPVSYVKKATGVPELGFIAEEVQEVYPTAVAEGAKGVHYSRLTAVLVSAVQELKQQLDTQALEIKELKKA
jgi:hypothetical protein